MDNSTLLQELIDALRDNTRANDTLTQKLDSIQASGGGASSAGKKAGQYHRESVRVKVLGKQWPTEHGWFKAKLGTTTDGEWYETKSKSIGALLEVAYEGEWFLDITYDEKRNGEYTNRYLGTVKKAAGAPVAPGPRPAPEPVDETPW